MDDKTAVYNRKRLDELKRRLKITISDIFQIDSPDLDFGVYRIMNQKRGEITKFMNEDLIDAVDEEFGKYDAEVRETIVKEKEEIEKKIREEIDESALCATGVKSEYLTIKIARELNEKWNELKEREKDASMSDLQKAEIFEHLEAFFSRYYKDGDFLSLRRYAANEKYAVPYNGEEVLLHWANKDQYYIKTDRFLKGHGFDVGAYRVMFEVAKVENQEGNGSGNGNNHYFMLSGKEDEVEYDDEKKLLTVRFSHVPLSDDDLKERFPPGASRQKPNTDDIVDGLVSAILAKDCIPGGLKKSLGENEKETDANPRLRKHVLGFTKESTSDFFIHKDLGGFLRQELDFFIKNEVFRLDDLGTENEVPVEKYVKRAKVLKTIALRIIDFLAQLEEFQKMLWEKKKFVLQTDYCITVDHIPEKYYDEICRNFAQVEEWKRLYAIGEGGQQTLGSNGAIGAEFMKSHPYLVLDTAFFDDSFKDRVLEDIQNPDGTPITDLDEATGGLMIKSENWQALNLLQERYGDSIKLVHIDPPYNTDTSGFLYKNNYHHSSWMSMMFDKLVMSVPLVSEDGLFACHIDENEYERLWNLFTHTKLQNIGTIIWDKRNPMTGGTGLAIQHEYIICQSKNTVTLNLNSENTIQMIEFVKNLIRKYGSVNDEVRKEYTNWLNQKTEFTGGEKSYRYIDEHGQIYQSVSLRAPEPRSNPKFFIPLIHPKTGKACPVPPNGFSRTPETLQNLINKGEILFGDDETTQPRQKMILSPNTKRQMTSVIQNAMKGKADTDRLGLKFPYCHPVSLYEMLIESATEDTSTIIDFFAGSGTTGHAVLNLNKKETSNIKYILVEIGDYFHTITKPRIQKVAYSSNWKDGEPQNTDGQSNIFKYMVLESYEDTLDNIEFLDKTGHIQTTIFSVRDYMLRYFLDFETKESPCRLNIDKMATPFAYTLKVRRDSDFENIPADKDGFRDVTIDLVETFNYLLGLHVLRRVSREHNGVPYRIVHGTTPDKRKVTIVWRNSPKNPEEHREALEADATFISEKIRAEFPDTATLYVNGHCFVSDSEPIEPVFKKLMGA